MSEKFDKALRDALRPIDPGVDFTDAVMKKLDGVSPSTDVVPPSAPKRFIRPRWLTVGLAASLIATVGIVEIQQQRQNAEGMRARRQLLNALQVTSEKLNLAYKVVHEQPSIEIEGDAVESPAIDREHRDSDGERG